jgi:hypothetical protein
MSTSQGVSRDFQPLGLLASPGFSFVKRVVAGIVFVAMLAGGAVALNVSLAHAASPTPEIVINNYAQELTECAAYYSIVSVAMENSNQPDAAQRSKNISDDALLKALLASEKAGLKSETVKARYEMAITSMVDRIDENTSNISILMADYHELCIEAMTDMEKRLQYWTQKLSR